jgi:predicted MFS family arabinose efflux permease
MEKHMIKSGREKLWTKDYVLVIFSAFFGATVFFCMGSGVSLFVDLKGGSTSLTGIMTFGYALGAVAGGLLGGRLCDTLGTRKVLMIFSFGCGVASLLPVVHSSLISVVIMRLLQGILFSCFSVAIPSAVAELSPSNRLGEGMGYSMMAMALSEAVGPTLAIKMFAAGRISAFFILCAGFFLTSSFLAMLRRNGKTAWKAENSDTVPKDKPNGGFLWQLIEKKALPMALVFFIFSFSPAFVWNYLPLYVKNSGITSYSVFYILQLVSMFLARLVSGKLIDRCWPLRLFAPPIASGLGGFFLMLTGTNPLFLLSGLFFGYSSGFLVPLLNTVCLQDSPPDRSGSANATFLISNNIGTGFGGLLWGKIIDLSGGTFQLALIGTVISVALAGLLGFVFIRKSSAQKNLADLS